MEPTIEITKLIDCIRGAVLLFWLAGYLFTMGIAIAKGLLTWDFPSFLFALIAIPFWPLFLGMETV